MKCLAFFLTVLMVQTSFAKIKMFDPIQPAHPITDNGEEQPPEEQPTPTPWPDQPQPVQQPSPSPSPSPIPGPVSPMPTPPNPQPLPNPWPIQQPPIQYPVHPVPIPSPEPSPWPVTPAPIPLPAPTPAPAPSPGPVYYTNSCGVLFGSPNYSPSVFNLSAGQSVTDLKNWNDKATKVEVKAGCVVVAYENKNYNYGKQGYKLIIDARQLSKNQTRTLDGMYGLSVSSAQCFCQ